MTEKGFSPQLSELLAEIEAASGLNLCLKSLALPVTAQPLFAGVPARYSLHLTDFCLGVKTTRNEHCRQCDLRDVPALAQQMPTPFVNRCHADASEIIIPVVLRNSLVMLGYLGQFREHEAQPESLPLLGTATVLQLLRQSLLLQRYLQYEVEHSADLTGESALREHLIHNFLQTHLRENPGLPEVARILGLSPSRASHLIKELTGSTFVALKQQYQIQFAQKLLATTLFTIEHVADETGFADPRYFYRVFSKVAGMPPARWREQQRRAVRLQA